MKLNRKGYIILLSLFLISPYSSFANNVPNSFWDGVLLANKTDNEIIAFIDQTTDIDNLIIIANIDGKKISHSVEKYGRLMKITLHQNTTPNGFILVKKLGFVVASVRLSEVLPTKIYYLKARVSIMNSLDKKSGKFFIKRNYATINKNESSKKTSNSPSDILSIDNLNQGFTLKKDRDPNAINAKIDTTTYIYSSSTFILEEEEKPLAQKDLVVRGVKNSIEKQSNYMLFEKYIHESTFPFYKFKSNTQKVGVKVKKDAKQFDGDYKVINDFNSWLHLEHRTSKENFAFDGESLFKIEENYFRVRYLDKEKVQKFLRDFYIYLKPYNKKLLGIYYQEHEILAIKSNEDYLVKVSNNNSLIIITGRKTYYVYIEGEFLIVKNKDKLLHKINKGIFHQTEQFYFKN